MKRKLLNLMVTATSRFSSGGLVTENFASRDINGLHVQVRHSNFKSKMKSRR